MTFAALDSALLGPLFTTQAMAACFSDDARLGAMLGAEAALARAQATFGLIPSELADALDALSPTALDPAAIGRATALAGVPTIPFVQAVGTMLPPAQERGFHKGATTQDIMDTALALQVQSAFGLLEAEIGAVLDGLSALALAHRGTPCTGRTYGQHAAPTTFGFCVAVWLAGIAEAAEGAPALPASLGGPVGTLAGLGAHGPAVADRFAAELGLPAAPLAWHTRRTRIAQAGCWLATLIGALAKMATDVAHLASTEVGEVMEPFVPGRGGSTAMPHKRNPVGCTVILAAHAAAPGLAATLLGCMAAAHERPPGLWHAEWHALPQLFGLAAGALREARALAEGLEVDTGRMRANLDLTRGLLFADAAAARLAASMGREAAHHAVTRAAADVRSGGETLLAVLTRMAPDMDVRPAFDLAPAIAATGPWVDRAVAVAAETRKHLRNG